MLFAYDVKTRSMHDAALECALHVHGAEDYYPP